jgi:putative membrane protein
VIRGYSDHAANERTFLAWVRTGIAVIAFGFVIERFTLFVLAMANSPDPGRKILIEKLSGPLGRCDGLALISFGIVLIVAAAVRFVRIGRRLDDQENHSACSIRAELILSTLSALVLASFSLYLTLG